MGKIEERWPNYKFCWPKFAWAQPNLSICWRTEQKQGKYLSLWKINGSSTEVKVRLNKVQIRDGRNWEKLKHSKDWVIRNTGQLRPNFNFDRAKFTTEVSNFKLEHQNHRSNGWDQIRMAKSIHLMLQRLLEDLDF